MGVRVSAFVPEGENLSLPAAHSAEKTSASCAQQFMVNSFRRFLDNLLFFAFAEFSDEISMLLVNFSLFISTFYKC